MIYSSSKSILVTYYAIGNRKDTLITDTHSPSCDALSKILLAILPTKGMSLETVVRTGSRSACKAWNREDRERDTWDACKRVSGNTRNAYEGDAGDTEAGRRE